MRTLRTLLAGLAAGAAALAVAVPVSAREGGPDCFLLTQWDGWRAQDARTINLRIRPDQVFQISLYSDCPTLLTTTDGIGVTPVGGQGEICRASDINPISVRDKHLTEQCPVRSVRRLSPAEIAALPPKARPGR